MHTRSRTRYRWAALALAVAVSATMAPLSPATAAPATLLSQDKVVTASSTENPDYLGARAAFDGNTATRWASAATNLQWIQVDLGESAQLSEIVLTWEAAYGKAFTVQASEDGATWTTLATVTNGTGGEQTLGIDGHGRYVRLALTARGTGYGYSLWELQVFGTPGGTGGPVDPEVPVTPGQCGTANAALGKVATASSTENSGTPASSAVDANAATRWSSQFSDGQWWQVDLGAPTAICGVDLTWEASYGKDFRVQTSLDGVTWTTATTVTDGTGGKQSLDVAATGRYVRLDLTRRANGYGYSLWEVAVRTGDGTPTGPQLPGGGDLGPNVHVFTPSTPTATIQVSLDEAFAAQEENQFGPRRDQFLFAPGTYDVNANIGFNTSISGLGRNPDDVTIKGGIWVDAGWFDGNATQNFWRSAENMAIEPLGGEARWAVSQAAPFRRMHVKGSLNLAPSSYGWASGGFIADSVIDGTVGSYSQQQWFTRDSNLGKWEGSVWNMVFSGVTGSPAPSFPNPSHTVLLNTPVIADKPYLYLDGSDYAVFVPSVRTEARGASWVGGSTPGTSIPLSKFYVAQPGVTAETLNLALAQGLNLLFTPGVYHLDKTINVTRANTVVLGLGYATIVPEGGVTAMKVADVGGVKIAALLFDAGTTKSPFLLQVGTPGSHVSHAANPTSIHDVFARVGGAVAGKVDTAIQINSDDTIVDHIWSWRGDHGAGIGWDVNTSDYGFVVNGDRVSAYGLFVEHFQKYNTLWNGNGGRTVFYQNELPYDVPSQAAYQNGSTRGYAAYKVADTVTSHEAWGLGAYTYFSTDPTIVLDNGFEVPITPGVRMHNLLTVSLGGNGTVQHVINGTGSPAQGTATIPSYVSSYQ